MTDPSVSPPEGEASEPASAQRRRLTPGEALVLEAIQEKGSPPWAALAVVRGLAERGLLARRPGVSVWPFPGHHELTLEGVVALNTWRAGRASGENLPTQHALCPPHLTALLAQIDALPLHEEVVASRQGYELRRLPHRAREAVETLRTIPPGTRAHAEAQAEVEAQLRLILTRLREAQEERARQSLDRLRELRRVLEDEEGGGELEIKPR